MYKLYLDMDGVLSDFDRSLATLGVNNESHFIHLPKDQWTPAQTDLDRRVREKMEDIDFWHDMAPMPDAYELWSYARTHDTYILTATPNITTIRDEIAAAKRAWIQKHLDPLFDPSRIIVCLRAEKKEFACPASILVDDMKANCDDWMTHQGLAVHHTSAATSIKQISEIVHA